MWALPCHPDGELHVVLECAALQGSGRACAEKLTLIWCRDILSVRVPCGRRMWWSCPTLLDLV